MNAPARNTLAVVGAGPVGLEAAALALEAGLDVHVFDRGPVGANVQAWGHVRLFTPWRDTIGPASARLLARAGWKAPDPDAHPTGHDLVERVLLPLAAMPELGTRVHAHAHVAHVGRRGLRRGEPAGAAARAAAPFRLLVRDAGGRENLLHAAALIDASGTYGTPAWAGSGGIPARGELYLAPQMAYRCEDVAGLRRARHAGRRTIVIGGGACAATTVTALAALADAEPGTRVAWATRGAGPAAAAGDPLPERAALFAAAAALRGGAHPAVDAIAGVTVESFEFNSATHRYRVALAGDAGNRVEEVDEVVVNNGFGPDESLLRELQIRTCPVTGAAAGLGEALRAGTLPPATAEALAHPEPGLHVLGAKSYGRSGGFLLAAGYAQAAAAVRALAAAAAV